MIKKIHKALMTTLFAVLIILPSRAAITLPSLISDNMVLQQDVPIHIWGKASPGEHISVNILNQKQYTVANIDGNWQVWLHPMKDANNITLTVSGENTLVIKNILLGDVWFAAGQSNMEWSVRKSNNSKEEIANANFPEIRFFDAERSFSDTEKADIKGKWVICSPETVEEMTGAGYFFARGIHQHLKLPIGLIDASWGATRCEAWTPIEAFKTDSRLNYWTTKWEIYQQDFPKLYEEYEAKHKNWKVMAEKAKQNGAEIPKEPREPKRKTKFEPSVIYNGVVAPLSNYTIKGVIWYQGENNAYEDEAYPYRFLFPTMIEYWREAWKQGDIPFIYAQLSTLWKHPYWPVLRESQAKALKLKNTAMVATYDIGDSTDAHFKNKQAVGKRFELAARKLVYGEDIVASGPIFRQMTIEGGFLRIWFDNTDGLVSSDGKELVGFEIAGDDQNFYPAKATMDGNTILIYNKNVPKPSNARYLFKDVIIGNLTNRSGLPAFPFREQVKEMIKSSE